MIKIPDSYFKNGILACYILLIPLYAFFFLIGAKPFHLDTFMQVTQGQLAFRAAIMASIELVVVLLSRLSMLLVRSKHQINYTGFVIWELMEALVITMFCALFVWLMDPSSRSRRERSYDESRLVRGIVIFPTPFSKLIAFLISLNIDISSMLTKICP